ncbi:MAG: coproporphyrinogen III oxidase family protein, partial [bacterium]|nr:coproporphyrinogen III oxidase family protein [bacterium]
LHRVEQEGETYHALERIVKTGFPFLNIDLIYGIPGQSVKSWMFSLEKTLSYSPAEIYLYPLYIRPLTALKKKQEPMEKRPGEADIRIELYKTGRDFLKNRGYRQLSMRHFVSPHYPEQNKTEYSCQEDGMVGMGCGARSYTGGMHYSSYYAVSRNGISQILNDYISAPTETFAYAYNGIILNEEDKKRRLIIKTLLLAEGLDLVHYRKRFSTEAQDEFEELRR